MTKNHFVGGTIHDMLPYLEKSCVLQNGKEASYRVYDHVILTHFCSMRAFLFNAVLCINNELLLLVHIKYWARFTLSCNAILRHHCRF